MDFSDYKKIATVLVEFGITYTERDFITGVSFPISDFFRNDLATVMQDGIVDNSEFAICENLIYPVLKEVWKQYRSTFTLWSHQALTYSERLAGFPEYILARRSPLGKVVFDQPYLILVEAKQDRFDEGWGQCLAEMVAAQRLNESPDLTIFGIVSNGNQWEFGQLQHSTFTKNRTFYTIQDLDQLFAAVNDLFQRCDRTLQRLTSQSP